MREMTDVFHQCIFLFKSQIFLILLYLEHKLSMTSNSKGTSFMSKNNEILPWDNFIFKYIIILSSFYAQMTEIIQINANFSD